jgi:diguanylate cyclase (GGDEF)-like protein
VRLALGAGAAIVGVFLLTTPIATLALPAEPGFIAAYTAWLSLGGIVTSIMLFAAFVNQRSAGLLVLANGSLLMALDVTLYLLASPGVLRGAGPTLQASQSAAWLCLLWHAFFPICILAYVAVSGAREAPRRWGAMPSSRPRGGYGRPTATIAASIAVSVAAFFAFYAVCVVGGPQLPTGQNPWVGPHHGVTTVVAGLSATSLLVLSFRRSKSVLDLWLIVGLIAWLADLGLSGLIDDRYQLGWYAARAFGMLASSSLLLALLIESATHYGRLSELNEALVVSNRALEHLSLHDALTGLPNRRYFDTYLGRQASLTRRHRRSLALILCDVDSFKAYNDRYGHLSGDECLMRVATALRSCCRRPTDLAARYGGEEFALILPETDLVSALSIAEAAREAVLRLRIPHAQSLAGSIVTISGGVAVLDPDCDVSLDALMAAADEGLFRAKSAGRNRMTSAPLLALTRA